MFAFELLHAAWDAEELRTAIEATTRERGAAWVLSNHDFGRLVTRFGAENARAAALLLLTLPGTAFLYQGDEIGQADGPGGERRYDRAGRDRFRHPMQWDGSPGGGFTSGEPWLPLVDPSEVNVEAQRDDPASTLTLVRELIRLRRSLPREFRLLDAADGVLAYARGEYADRGQHDRRAAAPFRAALNSCSRPSRAFSRGTSGRARRRHHWRLSCSRYANGLQRVQAGVHTCS